MATVNKNFKVKHGLVVEGTTGTINGEDILTTSEESTQHIIDIVGGETLITSVESTQLEVISGELNVKAGVFDAAGDADAAEAAANLYTDGEIVTALTTAQGYATQALSDAEDYADGLAVNYESAGSVSTHSGLTTGVHGVTGDVVGTSDTQTLTSKTLGSGTNLSVALDMNGNKIEDLGTPTAGTDATTKNYVDDADTATLGSANSYTDGEISDLDTSLRTYADQAETDAKAYTDTRETAITSAYQTYADDAEADAISTAAAYTDQAETDAIDAAATAAAALYAPLAGATFTGDVLLPGDPTQALGAATKQYVDAVAEGLHVHASAVAATTTNINLATGGLLLVDNVQLVADNRVLVKDQSTPSENGIYLAKAGAWVRADDYNSSSEIQGGDFTFVTGGDTYGSTGWVQVNIVTTLGTDPIEFDQFSGAGEYTAGTGLELNGTSFSIDETYTATKSYVDDEITALDGSLKTYADQAETDAKAYTDTRETAITTAYEAYADQAEADANTYADGVALTAENNAKAYTDTRESAITTAYQNYADLAEADANLYTDDEIAALDSDDIEEGTNNLYFTNQRAIDAVGGTIGDQIDLLDTDDIEEGATNFYFTDTRAKISAADLITNATKTNITITGDENGLTITAENGVADSTTTDLAEGTNLYFTDARAVTANTGLWDTVGAAAAAQTAAEGYADGLAVNYDAAGSAAAAQTAAEGYADGLVGTLSGVVDNLTTTDIAEGTSLYFTDERARNAIGTALTEGANIDITVDGVADTITVALVDDVVIPTTGSLEVESNDFNVGADSVGLRTSDAYTNAMGVFSMDADDDYAQLAVKNTGSGVNSSSDVIAYANNGDDASGWIDLGITSATFADESFTITGANDGYIFMEAPIGTTGDGNLVLATGANGATNAIVFAAGGLSSDNTQMTITPDESVRIVIDTPSTSPSTGALIVDGGVGIQGDVNIQGNITFGGEGTSLTTENLAVTDPLIYVGDQNAGDAVDMGIVTEYKDGATTKFAGVVRDASDGIFKIFSDATTKPTSTVDFAEAGLEYGDLKLDALEANSATLTNVTIGMVDETEIAHLNGVTSSIQDQLDSKQGELTAGANIDITGATISVTGLDTDDVSEGTNLYFTDARAVDALEAVVPNFTEIDINSVATQVAATASATAATANTVYSFAKADYRSAKFLVKVAYSTHTEISEVLLTLDTSDNIAITEYAIVGTNGSLSTVTAEVSGANVNLLVNPANTSTVTVMGTLLA
jgi:hypothetical protein